MENQLQKNIIWNAFGNLVYLGLQWVVTVMVTRLMGLEDAGVLSLAMSVSASFWAVAAFGIRNFQVSDINNKYSDSCYVNVRIITCAAAFVLCAVFSCVNGYSLKQIVAINLYMIFRLAEVFSDVLYGIFQKNNRLDIAGKSCIIRGLATVMGFFSGYAVSKDLNVSLVMMSVCSLMSTFLFDFTNVRKFSRLHLKTGKNVCIALLKETVPLCAVTFFTMAISTAPKYILEKMTDETTLGAYSSIFAPALLIQNAANYIFVPFTGKFALFYQNSDVKGFIRLLIRICAVILALSIVVIIGAMLFGEWGLVLLFGESICQYIYLLFPILMCVFASALLSLFSMLCVVVRAFKLLIIANIVGFVACSAFTPLFINCFGANGASYGFTLGMTNALILCIVAVMSKLRLNQQ